MNFKLMCLIVVYLLCFPFRAKAQAGLYSSRSYSNPVRSLPAWQECRLEVSWYHVVVYFPVNHHYLIAETQTDCPRMGSKTFYTAFGGNKRADLETAEKVVKGERQVHRLTLVEHSWGELALRQLDLAAEMSNRNIQVPVLIRLLLGVATPLLGKPCENLQREIQEGLTSLRAQDSRGSCSKLID